ncbi:C45 family peptidase [Microbacterium sp. OR21]|uniref:C45 family autoproteolytic acyltransferase/hydolase n=1 Tax=Microbacterium sp. OR21 TaxID=3095346 RepID=UPI0039B4B3D7
MTAASGYPRIRVSGDPYERGLQYGTLARRQVRNGRDGYERNFAGNGIDWAGACALAERYAGPIRRHFPQIWRELEGIAAGSGLDVADVLAMNCRTEIMWERANRAASEAGIRGECTSFGLAPDRTAIGRTLIGQNWDWLVHSFDSVVVLEVEREDEPNYVTIVEAGLLAKFSLNAHGLAVGVNTLATTADIDTRGIPFHVLLRALVDCRTTYDAVELLAGVPRAASGNFLVGTPDGAILDIECEPGCVEGVHVLPAFGGQVAHANHFLSRTVASDLALTQLSDSYVRQQRMTDLLAARAEHTQDSLHAILTDHVGSPGSICCHPDSRTPEAKQWASICSIVIDPAEREVWLCEGIPCRTERRRISCAELLSGER